MVLLVLNRSKPKCCEVNIQMQRELCLFFELPKDIVQQMLDDCFHTHVL